MQTLRESELGREEGGVEGSPNHSWLRPALRPTGAQIKGVQLVEGQTGLPFPAPSLRRRRGIVFGGNIKDEPRVILRP